MPDDPIVSQVRRIRDELAAKFNYDVHSIFADLRAREAAAVEAACQNSNPKVPVVSAVTANEHISTSSTTTNGKN